MANDKDKNSEDLMKFAIGELNKTMESLKKGKIPKVSPELKKMLQMLQEAAALVDQKKITEDDMGKVVLEAVKQVKKSDPGPEPEPEPEAE